MQGEAATLRLLFERAPGVDASHVGERVVLYSRALGRSLILNPSGSWLWRQLDAPMSAATLADKLRAQFPESAERALADVEAFLRALIEHGAVCEG